MEQIDVMSARARLTRPLCRRYAVASLRAASANLGGHVHTVRWGLGSIANGESEVLGVWIHQEEGGPSLPEIFRELHDRGAEVVRIGVGNFDGTHTSFNQTFRNAKVVGSIEEALEAVASRASARHRVAVTRCLRAAADAEHVEAARSQLSEFQGSMLGERYPEVVRLWDEALAGFKPIYALDEQLRGLIRLTDQKAAEASGQLMRAISRHGSFTDSAAALDFVAASLARTEQRWDRERAATRASRGVRLSRRAVPVSGTLGVTTLA